ncbi:hypothetical protein CANARDRAFT_9016 [[Candida] arabinofermentans NRRL YB-2248]|uniref:Histidinol-phosphatase n=1 Tax=[Candida] arabinofermentans NRRL YB-2248 TaxID=983967 RepID=A0A1E4SWZ5_9ASCO|nr:hypothetical protein CANARDRAFT_9016 [[Candida] arabinofermentans NRRL YB-2248]
MVHSHHSHSGQYVSHAVDTLEQVIDKVKLMNFKTFCLTEHVPRYSAETLYPEEIAKGYTPNNLIDNFNNYYKHAIQIQKIVNNDESNGLKILVGFEIEGGIDAFHLDKCLQLKQDLKPDVIVGSVHHLNGIPIDFDRESWLNAKGTDTFKDFYKRYFQTVLIMISKLKPEIIGHLDLIRLMVDLTNDRCEITGKLIDDVNIELDWPDVWNIIVQIVEMSVEQGTLIELNSAAIRKGWSSPYPKKDIVELVLSKGGKFCLSDDSHGLSQIGLNYEKVLKYIKSFHNFEKLYYWDIDLNGDCFVSSVDIKQLELDPFWLNYTTSTN